MILIAQNMFDLYIYILMVTTYLHQIYKGTSHSMCTENGIIGSCIEVILGMKWKSLSKDSLFKDIEDIYTTPLKKIGFDQVNVCWLLFFSKRK